MDISLEGLNRGNPIDCLRLCYLVNPDKIKNAFKKVKIKFEDEKGLDMLAKIHEQKLDVEGKFRDPEDENIPLMFDVMRVIGSIEFSPEEIQKIQSITFSK